MKSAPASAAACTASPPNARTRSPLAWPARLASASATRSSGENNPDGFS